MLHFFSNVYVCKIGRALRQFLALDTSSIKMLSELLSELLCRWDKGRIYTRGSTIWGPQNSHLIKTSQCFVLRIHSTVQNSAYCTSPLYLKKNKLIFVCNKPENPAVVWWFILLLSHLFCLPGAAESTGVHQSAQPYSKNQFRGGSNECTEFRLWLE